MSKKKGAKGIVPFLEEGFPVSNELFESAKPKLPKCDGCGKQIKGVSFDVYDENHNRKHGLSYCASCAIPKL